jgi:hypothetical protein
MHERDVDAAVQQGLHLVPPVDTNEIDDHIGVTLAERAKGSSDRITDEEPHRQTRRVRSRTPHAALRRIGSGQQRARVAEQLLAGRSQLYIARRPSKQTDAKLLLETTDLTRQHRLRHEQPPRCPPKVKLLRNRHEIPKSAQIQLRRARHIRPPLHASIVTNTTARI